MYKSYSMELAGRTLTVDIGRVAKQANGAALMHYGDTTVLATATASKEPREGIDFFPLSVEYEEKMYAVGKIPGGFNKREGKASEHAILTSRVIDRPMRPLFPKDYRNDVTLVDMVMSVDPECNPEIPAMLGSFAYAIGQTEPVAVEIDTQESGYYDDAFLTEAVRRVFDFTPAGMIRALDLDKPFFAEVCNNCHFMHPQAAWEQTDKTEKLRMACAELEDERT